MALTITRLTGKVAFTLSFPVLVLIKSAPALAMGNTVGFKPEGGIRKAKQSLEWLILMKEELGTEWLSADLFRFGASGLLGDIERQLEHFVTGRYSASYRHPMA